MRLFWLLGALLISLAVGAQLSNGAQLRAEPKEEEGAKKDAKKGFSKTGLEKPMPLKAQEQGFHGKHVKHTDGKTGTADWQDEYGNAEPAPAAIPQPHSGSAHYRI